MRTGPQAPWWLTLTRLALAVLFVALGVVGALSHAWLFVALMAGGAAAAVQVAVRRRPMTDEDKQAAVRVLRERALIGAAALVIGLLIGVVLWALDQV